MFAESQAAYWREREENLFAAPIETLERLARGPGVVGDVFGAASLGRIQPGAPADVVVLDYQPPTPLTAASLPDHWMFGLSGARVRDVVVAGDVVVRDRRLTKVDQNELAAKAAVEGSRLWERMDGIGPHPFGPREG
jgi:cytosine/adenosine deaminase-related metal-dependent hydrolase